MIITVAKTMNSRVTCTTRALDDAVSMSESQKAILSARKSLWFMVRFTSIRRCRVEFSSSGNHSTPWSKSSDPLAGTLEAIRKWRKVEIDTLLSGKEGDVVHHVEVHVNWEVSCVWLSSRNSFRQPSDSLTETVLLHFNYHLLLLEF